MKNKISLLLDLLIILSSSTGIYLTISHTNFMNGKTFLYYTVQSNIYVLIISIIFLIYKILKKQIPNYLFIIKFICTVGITITFLVFTFLLIPQMFGGYNSYLLSLGNITVHFLSPILTVISFIIYDKIKIKKHTYLYGTIMPLLYCISIIILTSIITVPLFGDFKGVENRFPYFFMDYETNGWFLIGDSIWKLGFFYWIIIIFGITIIISNIYLKLCDYKNKR